MIKQKIKTTDGKIIVAWLPETEAEAAELERLGLTQNESLGSPDIDEADLVAAGVLEPE